MIISDSRKKVFCHIPKNGGSSLRAYWMEQWDDARAYQGRKEVEAVAGAIRDLTHITPLEANSFFGDDMIARGYGFLAVVRAPMPRFSSALLQYIRTFAAQDKHFVSADTVRKVMENTEVEELCAASGSDYRCIHFRPQSDFVAGIPVAHRDLILIEDLAVRFPELPVENPGGSLPAWMKFARQPVIKRLTRKLGQGVKNKLSRQLISKDPEVKTLIDSITAENVTFLRDFYAADQVLYDALRG